MNKTGIFSLGALALSMMVVGCGKGIANNHVDGDTEKGKVTKDYSIGNFNAINCSSAIQVVFTQGANPGNAVVETEAENLKYLNVSVSDNTLFLFYKNAHNDIKGKTVISVSSPVLTDLNFSGASQFSITNDFESASNFSVEESGASQIKFNNIKVSESEIEVSGASQFYCQTLWSRDNDIEASGASQFSAEMIKGGDLEAKASGASTINISGFDGNEIDLNTSGASNISVSAINGVSMEAKSSGASSVSLQGKVETATFDCDMASQIKKSDLTVTR